MRYLRGADSDAIAAWDGLIARRDDLTPDDVSRALFWRTKALTRLGRNDDARLSLEQAAAVRPSSYYSLRAAFSVSPVGGQQIAPSVSADDDQQFTRWIAARNQDLSAAAAAIASDPALLRAQADASLGLFREGNWEADELLQRYPDRPDRPQAE